MELVKKVYDIERKIKLEEAKIQLFFWGVFLSVESLLNKTKFKVKYLKK